MLLGLFRRNADPEMSLRDFQSRWKKLARQKDLQSVTIDCAGESAVLNAIDLPAQVALNLVNVVNLEVNHSTLGAITSDAEYFKATGCRIGDLALERAGAVALWQNESVDKITMKQARRFYGSGVIGTLETGAALEQIRLCGHAVMNFSARDQLSREHGNLVFSQGFGPIHEALRFHHSSRALAPHDPFIVAYNKAARTFVTFEKAYASDELGALVERINDPAIAGEVMAFAEEALDLKPAIAAQRQNSADVLTPAWRKEGASATGAVFMPAYRK